MTIKDAIANFISHLAPLSLVKQINPVKCSTEVFSQSDLKNKPWIDAHKVELTPEDFAEVAV